MMLQFKIIMIIVIIIMTIIIIIIMMIINCFPHVSFSLNLHTNAKNMYPNG